jgi:hypothetical protein
MAKLRLILAQWEDLQHAATFNAGFSRMRMPALDHPSDKGTCQAEREAAAHWVCSQCLQRRNKG